MLPEVERVLSERGISTERILVNVGDEKLTKNEDIREFNRLDMPASRKQFILLVNKGREGWNCRSLFAVALYRKPKSKIFVLQATTRYLNLPCLEIESLLTNSVSGMEAIVARVNEFNEILYDHIIPRLFNELYTIKEFTDEDPQDIELVKIPERGYYTVTAHPGTTSLEQDYPTYAAKSFHLDAYSFGSTPEYNLFNKMLSDHKVKKIFFTGMLTHGQSEFFIQYIDQESHTVRSYYPDFLVQDETGQYFIVEVKADYQIDAPVVLAKKNYAEKLASASNMKYVILKASDAQQGRYQMIWEAGARQQYLDGVIAESRERAGQGE